MAEETTPVTIYTPESHLRLPRRLAKAMWCDLKNSTQLAWRLFVRDFSARYRQSVLGLLWAFMPAVLSAAVFIVLQAKNIINFGDIDVPYPVYAITGTILWQTFTESITAPLKAVHGSKSMLVKINFPREALIVAAFYEIVFSVAIKACVILGFLISYGIPLSINHLAALPAVLSLVLLGMGLGLMLTPVGMLYSDVESALTVLLQVLFFVTPVVYAPIEQFPYSLMMVFNPVSHLIVGAREALTKGLITDLWSFVLVSSGSLCMLMIAWFIYHVAMPIIIERNNS